MPIPSPASDESESAYVHRCMEAIGSEYDDQQQAVAICYAKFREGKSVSKNEKLLELVKGRKGSGEFGYGICTADRYVADAVTALGNGMLMKHFHCLGQNGVETLIKRAAGQLTICTPDLEMEKTISSVKEMAKILGCEPPPHAMLAMVNRLTTPREDRDGDTLQTAGANVDPKSPMLWQHIHTLPIGKMVRIVEHKPDLLKVASVLLDINDLTSDAAKLFEAGALRFSHGFIAKEFEERKSSDSGGIPRFNITKFDIVEESAVSVPSNVDAEVELFCRGKLASDVFKAHAKSIFDSRNKSMPVTEKAKRIFRPEVTAALKAANAHVLSQRAKAMRKMFDVATERLEPSTQEQDWAARYIGCSVKDLVCLETAASGMMVGPFLAGLEAVTHKYNVTDTRNMAKQGEESPPVYRVIETKSDERKNFLVEGIRFGKATDHRIVWRVWEGWGDQRLLVYADSKEKASELIDKTWEWVEQHNPLKGQAFALAGGWISKTGTGWPDVFLEKEIENALRRTVRIVNEKGAEASNRGLVLAGPPGTGKTLSARVMLNEADCTFIWVSAKDFWKLGSYGAFAGAFQLARSLAPSIICFEDVDNWIDPFTVDLLKGEMDGLQQSSGVTTLLTTNFPDQLPSALIDRPGRFHDVLEIHLPTREVRLRMLQKWAAGADLASLAKTADETNGYSGAHIYELCHFAKVIRDEDECSLEDALTKAFNKVKEQRELINQNQLAGSSYRPGRREFNAMVAKGWKGKVKAVDTKLDDSLSMIGPTPHEGEDQQTFMDRCMLDPTMMDDYPTEENRAAACKLQWNKSPATVEDKAAVPYKKTPLSDATKWDADAAVGRLRSWAGVDADAPSAAAWSKYAQGFARKTGDANKLGDFSLPHHDVENGSLVLNRAGLAAAMGAVNGARANISWESEAEHKAVFNHLRRHYEDAKLEAPEMRSFADLQKAMGTCEGCGKKKQLNSQGYCEDCASEMDDDMGGADNDSDTNKPPKSSQPATKAGRVLSQRNFETLEDAVADIDAQLKIMELPRTAKALADSAKGKVQSVLKTASPLADPAPSSTDHVLRSAIVIAAEDRQARDRLRRAIIAFDKADENEQLADDFRKLESVLSPG